jgi:DNA-binding transcriptional LysR family regulator
MTTLARKWAFSGSTAMTAMLDVDQLRTFIAISETGSFTKAAEVVNKTQSAVSMQMKRLEERLERPIFSRDGRASKLTEDGQRLLDYARRIVKLNVETLAAFSDAELSGRVRMGVPDDYADRYLPEIMARFSRGYPAVELSVICEPSVDLLERIDANEIDLAIITNCESKRASETFRRERLLWVTSNRHSTHLEERMPLALGRPSCTWRRVAIERLEAIGRPFRVLYSSSSAGAVAAAVLAGLAVSVLPESGLRPGMRVLSASDGFPDLPSCRIGLVRNAHESSALANALAEHIISSLDNLSDAAQAAE